MHGDSPAQRFAATGAGLGSGTTLRGAALLETGAGAGASMSPRECLSFFNPVTRERYEEVTSQWSRTLLAMAHKVMERGDLPDHPPVPAAADVAAAAPHSARQAAMQPSGA